MSSLYLYFVTLFALLLPKACLSLSKKGIGLNPDNWSDKSNPNFLCGDMAALGTVTWWYDWGIADIHGWSGKAYDCPGGKGPAGFVPQIRKHDYTGVKNLPDGSFTAVIGFNEPNRRDQHNVSPAWAAKEWLKIQKNYHDKVLVSPSPVPCSGDCNGGNITQWFDSFFKNCDKLDSKGCRVDFIATHIYSCSADKTMKILKDLYIKYKKKIWLTEFACPFQEDQGVINKYMEDVIPRLDAAEFVDRYAWFASRFPKQDWGPNWLLSSKNSLLRRGVSQRTKLGDKYMKL